MKKVTYFLGGAPAPAALLSQVGATDGAVTTTTKYYYLIEGLGIAAGITLDENGKIKDNYYSK